MPYEDIPEAVLNAPPRRSKAASKPVRPAQIARPVKEMPTSSEAIINNILAREIEDPSGPIEPISPTVELFTRLLEGIAKGTDISDIQPELRRVIAHQPEKTDALLAVLTLIDHERAGDWVAIRASTEKVLKQAARRGDFTTGEMVAVWQMAARELDKLKAVMSKTVKAVDTVTVVEKVDFHSQQVEKEVQRRYDGTTPQGREIMRKNLFDLKRSLPASVTVTKEVRTETSQTVPA
jgi:hypothetical protein